MPVFSTMCIGAGAGGVMRELWGLREVSIWGLKTYKYLLWNSRTTQGKLRCIVLSTIANSGEDSRNPRRLTSRASPERCCMSILCEVQDVSYSSIGRPVILSVNAYTSLTHQNHWPFLYRCKRRKIYGVTWPWPCPLFPKIFSGHDGIFPGSMLAKFEVRIFSHFGAIRI